MKNDSGAFWRGETGFYSLFMQFSGNLPPNYRFNRGDAASLLAHIAMCVWRGDLERCKAGREGGGGIYAGTEVPAWGWGQNL